MRARPPDQSFPFRIAFPPELPISVRAEEITAAIAAHQVIILAGETGSGKTTQIPKMCLAAGRGTRGRIACTQPRRVAALSISRRVAEEMGVEWGREVGCKIRFHDQTTSRTAIKFLTDGMLLAEVQGDPLLRDYDTIIIDEAHERSLNIDFLLGHLRTLRFKRPELKIVITSATIDTKLFSEAFEDAPVILVEGRTFPVEVIYAPLDELGSDVAEGDEREAKAEALHYIDGAVEAVERILRDSDAGDVLVFLPSERDIRETSELLEGRTKSAIGNRHSAVEIVPLFGRLSNAEQQRVFAPTQRRKIVLATNIAETSLTIPGIRFVVDTGLARISRYSPQARTRRLPIEEIAQSSADQRKGRAGRVAAGVCIRLYAEKDFLERPRFATPEIQRANLADVILRMKAFGLGDIERFPFINMPAAKSIRAGYALLEELGAIAVPATPAGEGRKEKGEGNKSVENVSVPAPFSLLPSPATSAELTPLGRELARLPVDPTVGRMILQARAEKALREVIAIAAGLSIQDPRERPLDKQQQADAAHRRFAHPDSDFLTLLNIWDAYHDEFENLSQAKLRRFCRDHFLSYTRMREWRDIHAQLVDVLQEREDFRMTSALSAVKTAPRREMAESAKAASTAKPARHKPGAEAAADPLAFGAPAYRAIHRSVLAGLLGNIAHHDEESGVYKATHDRKVALFPGSVLFKREEPKKRGAPKDGAGGAAKKSPKAPAWIMAAEIMETTRLYARTCARLDPVWALDLGAHLVRVAHSEPFWNESAGRVMVKQRTRLYGLELESRAVGYGKINPGHATEIFIREGLVNDTIAFPLDFLAHNRAVREKIEDLLTRARDSGYLNLDEAAYRFYAARLLPVAGLAEPGRPGSSTPATIQAGSESRPHPGISSVAELVDLVRARRGAEPRFLFMAPEDLRDPDTIAHDADAFPAALPIENRALPLNYAYKPGQADDGVTLEVGVREAEALTPAALDWAVPGHVEAKVEHFLRALPKELRRGFVPLGETAKTLAQDLSCRAGSPNPAGKEANQPAGSRSSSLDGPRNREEKNVGDERRGSATPPYNAQSFTEALAAAIAERYRIAIDPALWADKPLPDHLRVRVRVVDANGRELAASRDLAEIRAALAAKSRAATVAIADAEPAVWRAARAKWETAAAETWAWTELPARVLVTEQAGTPIYAYPGLRAGNDGVSRHLFKTAEEAERSTRAGIAALLERQLGHDLGWLERDLRALREIGALAATLAPVEKLRADVFESIRRWVCDPRRVGGARFSSGPGFQAANRGATQAGSESQPHLSAADFSAAVEKAKTDLRGLVPRLVDLLREILTLRQELMVHAQPYPGLERDLAALVPADFLRATPFAQLAEFPRYLRAMKARAERWRKNPAKDAERAAQLAPYLAAMAKLDGGDEAAAFRWLVEEFRVSLFAQELGTAEPVSTVKLDRALAACRAGSPNPAEKDVSGERRGSATPPYNKPMAAVPLSEKKKAPVKNLSALDKLFRP